MGTKYARLCFRSISILTLTLSLLGVPAPLWAEPVRGTVTDATHAALPRATVRLIDGDRVVASAMTDDAGRFAIEVGTCAGCRLEASLTGFRDAALTLGAADAADPDFRAALALDVAPIADAIVVSATREAAPASQVGASVTTFSGDDIARRGSVMLSDLVRETPGVAVIQSGGRGGQTSLFLRGGESTYTKVLLDGVPLNEPGGTFNFASLTTANLERVEVVRGAQSALYGSDAMAGVIQLFTARGRSARPEVTGALETGSYGTRRGIASVSGAHRGWDYSLAAASQATDNRAANNRFTGETLSVSAGGAVRPGLDARVIGRVEDGDAGTPGQTAFGRADLDAAFAHRDVVIGASLRHDLTPHLQQRLAYGYTRTRQDSTNLIEDAPYTPSFGGARAPFEFFDFTYDSHNVLQRQFASYQADGRFGTGRPVAGIVTLVADWDGERATLEDRLAGTTVAASRNNVGVSVQGQALGTHGSLAVSLRAEHNDSFGDKWVPRVSGAWIVSKGRGAVGETSLKANAGRGVKEPTILQSFSPNSFFLGNPDLLPEVATTWDAGVSQRFAHDRARVELVFFDNRYKNLISTRTVDFTTFASQYFNLGDTTARGIEVSAEAVVPGGIRVTSGYTFTDSEIVKSTSAFSTVLAEGNWAFRRPRHTAFVRAGLTRGRVTTDLAGHYIGTRVDSDFASLDPEITSSGGYWLWNASASVSLSRSFSLVGRVDNIGNVDYMEPLGYPAWRRTAHAGLRVRF